MAAFVVRVWLPDRPGALGAVASRIGAVRADVIGIDIIERGAGRAIDELVIDLADPGLVDLLLSEIAEVEGVDVETIRPLDGPPADPAVLALAVAGRVQACTTDAQRATELVEGAVRLLSCDWAVLVDAGSSTLLATAGKGAPSAGWLGAFVLGATEPDASVDGIADLALARLATRGATLVVGREHSPLRGREQEVLEGLAAIGDSLGELPAGSHAA